MMTKRNTPGTSSQLSGRLAPPSTSAGTRCVCGRGDQLQVHHLSYDHAGDGKEPDRDLLTLCRRHHELAHEYERSGQYGQPYAGRTLRKATEAMVRDQTEPAGCTPVRAWNQRLIGRRPG